MSVVAKADLLKKFSEIVGDDTSDNVLNFMSDLTDTLDDKEKNNSEDWKAKYEANDAEWRKKYRDRFMNGSDEKIEEQEHDSDENDEPKLKTSFDELFTNENKEDK